MSVLALAVVLAVGSVVATKGAPSTPSHAFDRLPNVSLDNDNDGIPDEMERTGWHVHSGVVHVTDPDRDHDGLSDGEEAGAVYAGRSDPNAQDSDFDGLVDPVEFGASGPGLPDSFEVSDPLDPDSDSDGVGDGDEYFADSDPLLVDTDDDGLTDAQELEFGSDPTLVNSDGDSLDDSEELDRNSSPLSYDLSKADRVAATEAGLKYGDCVNALRTPVCVSNRSSRSSTSLGTLPVALRCTETSATSGSTCGKESSPGPASRSSV